MEEERIVNLGGVNQPIPSPGTLQNPGNQIPGNSPSPRDMFLGIMKQNQSTGVAPIPASSFYTGKRFEETRPFTDYEEMAAQQQSTFDQYRNGLGKMVGLAATSFVSGTAGLLYGIGSAASTLKFSNLYNNPVTQLMDQAQAGMEDYLPNYYTKAEQDAEWWSPDNWYTANFWGDKVFKNIGYGLGSIAGGVAWTKVFKLLGQTNSLVRAGKGLETAANIEKAMQIVPKTQKLSAIESTLANLSQGTKDIIRNNGDRFLTSAMGTFGESSIESLQKMNEFRNSAIEEYKNKFGYAPQGEDLDEINTYAEKIGNYVWGMGTVLLTGSNYIQLPKILGSSRKVEKAYINKIAQEGLGKEFVEQVPKTRFGKLTDTVTGLGRFLVNPTEAAEEGMQFAIATGVDDYFDRAYKNKEELGTFLETVYGAMGNVFGEGIEKTLSTKEGIESIIIGSLAGGIQQAPMSIYREGLTGKGGVKAKNTAIALQELNKRNIDSALKDQADFMAIGIGSQSMRQQAIENNDVLSEKDYEKDFTLSYLMPRAKYGKMESVYAELEQYKQQALTGEGFQELQSAGIAFDGETKEQFVQRIGNLENTAKAVDKHYENINLNYAGVLQTDDEGNVVKDEKGNPLRKYAPVVVDKLVYAASKIDDYSARIPGVNAELAKANVLTVNILQNILENGKPNKESVKEALDQINAMDVTNDTKDDLKRSLSDLIELSLRRKLFINQYNDIKQKPLNYTYLSPSERVREMGTVEVAQKEGRKSVSKPFQVGQEYSLAEPIRFENGKLTLAPKLTILSETLGGEFEVRLPDGKEVFLSPLEFKTYNITEEDNTSQELEDILNQSIDDVLQYPAFRDVVEKPGEELNKLEYINSLGDQKLTKAVLNRFNKLAKELLEKQAKAKEIADRIKESKEELDKQQEDVSDNEPFPVGVLPEDAGERVDTGETGKMKSAVDFFDSSTTESEEFEDLTKSQPHIVRSRVFLNNAGKFKNRKNLRAIVFTYNQEESLGLSGATALSFKMTQEQIDSDKKAFEDRVNDPDNGFVGMVFVELDGKKRHFVDQDGKRIGEVGQQVDLGKVIFQTMPSTSITNSRGNDRYRKNEKNDFVNFAKTWRNRRVELMKPSTVPPMLEFRISAGIANTQKEGKVYKRNAVTSVLVDETAIATIPGLVNVVTTDTITYNGRIVNAKKGYVYIQSGDLIQYLNNNTLGKKKATTVYELIKSIVTKLEKDASEGKTPEFEKNKLLFIKNVLNYKNPKTEPKDNQIWFDVDNLTVKLGKQSIKFSELASKEQEIIEQISGMYHSASAKTLRSESAFFEYFLEDGKLQEREWKNYQSYLVSAKDRAVSDIPFVTIANPTDAQPYAFAGKYATLVNFETGDEGYVPGKKQEDPPKPSQSGAPTKPSDVIESDVPVVVKLTNKQGEEFTVSLNDGSENTMTMFGGEFNFKANILPNGEVEIDALPTDTNRDTFQKFASDAKKIATARKTYASATEGLNDYAAASVFYIGRAKLEIEKAISEQQAPAPVAPVAPVSELEAKKADIEKRRQEEIKERAPYVLTKDYFEGDYNTVATLTFKSNIDKTYAYTQSGVSISQEALRDDSRLSNITKEQYDAAIKAPELIKEINAKYDKELATLEKTESAEQPTPPTEQPAAEEPVEKKEKPAGKKKGLSGLKSGVKDDETRRVRTGESGGRTSDRDIEAFKAWHAKNVPNIPFEILESIITLHDGSKAWGVFENGVAKFFKRGLRGTEYHEVFEGIWKAFLTQGERQAILDEFKSKSGSFLDRESGQLVAYSQATDRQAKERIADDFADYRLGKLPARTLSEKIRNFFKAILEFFKTFVAKPSLKEDLFKSIDTGKFAEYVVSEDVKSAAPEYRKIFSADGTLVSEDEAWTIVQDMTITMAEYIFNRNNTDGLDKLFNPVATTGKDIYNYLRTEYAENIEILGEQAFQDLFLRSKDLIRTMGITVDVDGVVSTNDGDQNNRLYAAEAFEIDFQKNMRFAVKFALATNPAAETIYSEGQVPQRLKSKVIPGFDGALLNNFNKSFATILNKLSNTSLQKVDQKLLELVKEDGNYFRIINRLGGDAKKGILDYSSFNAEDWRFYIQFVQAFSKSNPFVQVAIQRVTEDGVESFTAPGDRTSALNKTRNEWFQNVKELSKSETSFIVKKKNDKGVMIYAIDDKNKYYPPKQSLLEPQRVHNYLKNIGIEFPLNFIEKINTNEKQKKAFDNAVTKIYEMGPKGYALLSGEKFSGVDSHVRTLADMYVRLTNPDQDTTRLNIDNQRTNNFSDSNAPSVFEAEFNEAMTLDELFNTRPELKDAFSTNSLLIKKDGMFFDQDGNKIDGKSIKIGVIDGLRNEISDRGVSMTSLTKGERFTVEINENINGNYYILVPADSSTERMIQLGRIVEYDLFNEGAKRAFKRANDIFKGYLVDEINLALDWKTRSKLAATKKNAKELRFFKDILEPSLVQEIHKAIAKGQSSKKILDLVSDEALEKALRNTLTKLNQSTLNDLIESGEVEKIGENYSYEMLDSNFAKENQLNRNFLSENEMMQVLSFVNMNYMTANIEMHKFIFGDPYQFKIKDGKLDETKRIKSWLSPRRITVDYPQFNQFLNDKYNDPTEDVSLDVNDKFRYTFKPYVKTATLNDVNPASEFVQKFYGYDEADGFSIIIDGAYREVKLKNGEWSNDLAEPWFQWNQSYARQKMAAKKLYDYEGNDALKKHDQETIAKPQPPFVTEVLKPIVSGSKFGVNRIEGVLDKFSQMPITYKMVENTNLENLYVQMLNEKVGYVVYKSARKEGVREGHSLYNGNGDYNSTPFGEETIEDVAWKTYGIQVENSYEEGKLQTRGSQLTKNDTMDMYDNGKEAEGMEGASALAEEKIKIFKEMHQNAYEEFLNKLGLEDLNGNYNIVDPVKISRELEYELLRRQASQNVIDTIRLNENGQFIMPFEASAAYEQIRSVLISMINKSLISPQMNGKPHVQVPATLWENKDKGRELLRKTKDGYVKISREKYNALSEKDKEGVVLSSKNLKFYENEDGKRYMEVMIPNFWKKHFVGMSDEQVLEYLNKPENQKILFGVGFRIPHQAMSSTEVFKIKGFLDPSMGSTVVVPSEIVAKAGSDFDIDKLNMYLKSVYTDANGNVKLIEYQGSKEATIDFFTKVYEEDIQSQLDKITNYDEFRDNVLEIFEATENIEDPSSVTDELLEKLLDEKMFKYYVNHRRVINRMKEQALAKGMSPADYVGDQMGRLATKFERLSKEKFSANLKNDYVNYMYKKSLENRYYEILEALVTLPGNFERLMSPVSDAGLSKVADTLDDATNNKEANIENKLISRSFMTSLRQAFVMAKKWVGIAAVNITGHAIGQKVGLYFDSRLIDNLSDYDKGFLGDLNLAIPHNTVTVDGQEMISLGGRTTAYTKKDENGKDVVEFISDRLSGYATSFVDVAKDPYILKLIQSELVVGTTMLMERIGAGELTPYFLNQPMIVEYLKTLDKYKSRSLFGKDNLEYIYTKFPVKSADAPYDLANEFVKNEDGSVNFEKSKENLLNLIRENANRPEGVKASNEFNAKQVAVFNEFLKLAKLAQLNFKFTQAYNYDTTRVTNYEGFKRKLTRTKTAEKANIISSIDKVMNGTFIGDQMEFLRKELKSLGEIMKLDSEGIDQYMNDVMEPFYADEYMSADDFDYIAKKLKTSFLDFLVQTRSTSIFPDDIKNLFTGNNSVASRLMKLKGKYPSSNLLSNLVPVSSLQENGPVTVALKVKSKDAIDIDRYTGMMRELKEQEPEFYNDLVKLSVLQGTLETNLSISSIIPVEDRAAIIAPVIDVLQPSSELEMFNKEGLFYRNNFYDDRIVPEIKPRYQTVDTGLGLQIDYRKTDTFLASLTNGITPGSGKLVSLNNKYSFMNGADKDFLKMRRYQYVSGFSGGNPTTIVVDITSGKQMSVKDFTRLSNEGLASKYEMVGYKKVKSEDGVPLTIQRKVGKSISEFSVFKMVNLYGAGRIVVEYPKLMTSSALDNNTFKIKEELTDNAIIGIFAEEVIPTSPVAADEKSLASEVLEETPVAEEAAKVTIQMQPANIEKIKAGTKTTTTRSESQAKEINIPVGESAIVNFDGQDFKVTNRGQLTIEEADGKEAMIKSEGVQSEEEFIYQQTKDWVNGKGKLYVYDIEPTVKEVVEQPSETTTGEKPTFTYKGTTITTDFQLTTGQREALEKLIDFSTDSASDFITLQGAAGTGKTSIIGYLQKYLKSHRFNFLAPTHAATAELAFATVKSGNKRLPMTVASAITSTLNPATNEMVVTLSKKLISAMGLGKNVFVVDEVSMLNSKDYEALKEAATRNDVKIIFMGDIMQIPQVDVTNPEKKPVSKAFTELDQVRLTEVKRTSSNSILNMLTNVRNNVNDKIPLVESSDQLEYLPLPKFNSKLADVFGQNPEETVLISYTNKGVEQYNKKIRSSLGREGDLVPGDVVVGYLGYSSKQIEKGDLANSVRYTVASVEKDGSLYNISASSKKLSELQRLGVESVSGRANTKYAQLSRSDSFDFSNLTEEDFSQNNKMLSDMMVRLHEAKQLALRTKSSGNWRDYFAIKGNISQRLANLDLGDTYIYNPATGVMEKYEYERHKKIDKDLIIEKGIDFGHAITIHKSQGSTVKNVFFDASSLPTSSSSKLTVNGEVMGTEKHSLLYVGVSRASEYLGINYANPSNFYDVVEEPVVEKKSRVVKVDQYQITVQPDGKMLLANGTEVTDQTIKNKVDIKIAYQDGTLRISVYNNNKYFVLSNNKIFGSGTTNLGKETVTDPKIKQEILDKAVLYKPKC